MTNNDITEEGLQRLADDLKKVRLAQYCAEHKPCDAKEHIQGYGIARDLFYSLFGSLIFGLVIMFGVNLVLADWLGVVPGMNYGTAIVGTASLYALRAIAKL